MSLSEKKFPNLKPLIFGGLLILLFIGLTTAGWQWWTVGRFVETTDNAYVEADVTAIAAKVSGYVSRILVEENSRVTAGQILFTIEDREFVAQVMRMRAHGDVNKAKIDTLTTQLKLQKSFIAQAKANMASAKAEQFRAQSDLERYIILQKDRAASRQKLDLAIANAENNHDLDVDELIVSEAFVGKNLVMKRWKPRARGRVGKILKPFSQLTIVLKEVQESA